MVPFPGGSSTRSVAEAIRRVSGSRTLTQRQRGMSTGIGGALEDFAGEDGKQGQAGALVFVAVEITLSAVPCHELGVWESLPSRGPADREEPSKIMGVSSQFGAGYLALSKIVEAEG